MVQPGWPISSSSRGRWRRAWRKVRGVRAKTGGLPEGAWVKEQHCPHSAMLVPAAKEAKPTKAHRDEKPAALVLGSRAHLQVGRL